MLSPKARLTNGFYLSQLFVLLRRQPQIASSPARLYPVLQHLPSLRCPPRLSASRQLSDLIWIGKRERPGQRCLQIYFCELYLPAAAKEECHVNGVVRFRVAGRAC